MTSGFETDVTHSSEQQTLFLQNMLKNTSQSPLVGTALSGAITSTTAQGYLPLYRGSATASLAPSMLNHAIAECDSQIPYEFLKDNGLTSLTPIDALAENRPPHTGRSQAQIQITSDASGAQGYMRYVTQKDDMNKKNITQAPNAETSATGTSRRSEW
jgi:hypothetical protein